jgi:TrmH family RNA methyltransferase
MTEARRVTSRDNPLLQRLRRLSGDGAAYRREGVVWIEGEHLCEALRQRGWPAAQAVLAESAWRQPALQALSGWADAATVVPDALFAAVSGLASPAGLGFLIEMPPVPAIDGTVDTVVLDRLQDAGNAGSILRSAAAFGVTQVLALKGTVALWSPKVLRAAMGAHFALRLVESVDEAEFDALRVPLLATSSHAGALLHQAPLPSPCAWVLGHEGQGVAPLLEARCALQLRIPQPGGEESLNVAAAAAVCLYESLRRRLAGAAQ